MTYNFYVDCYYLVDVTLNKKIWSPIIIAPPQYRIIKHAHILCSRENNSAKIWDLLIVPGRVFLTILHIQDVVLIQHPPTHVGGVHLIAL